jgi:hypothetical protein
VTLNIHEKFDRARVDSFQRIFRMLIAGSENDLLSAARSFRDRSQESPTENNDKQ